MADIVLNYGGKVWTIAENQAFAVGELVEEIVTIPELVTWGQKMKFFKIARCYGAMLRFAGAKVTDEDVHATIIAEIAAAGVGAEQLTAVAAVAALMDVLMGGAPSAEVEGTAAEKKRSGSSRRRS